jgi:hypothetical protein
MKTKEQTRIELERWLDIKAERDMYNTINGTDPYVTHHNEDIFDEYEESKNMTLKHQEWKIYRDGVDTG